MYVSAMTERQAGMAGNNHGDKTQEKPQAQEDLGQQQAAQDQPQVNGTDWEKAVAERDEKIAALETQVDEAAKNAETAEQLRGEIAELKAQGESDRIDFKLQLAGVRKVTFDLLDPVAYGRARSETSSEFELGGVVVHVADVRAGSLCWRCRAGRLQRCHRARGACLLRWRSGAHRLRDRGRNHRWY